MEHRPKRISRESNQNVAKQIVQSAKWYEPVVPEDDDKTKKDKRYTRKLQEGGIKQVLDGIASAHGTARDSNEFLFKASFCADHVSSDLRVHFARQLIRAGEASLVKYLFRVNYFSSQPVEESLASELIKAGREDIVVEYFSFFEHLHKLTPYVAEKLIQSHGFEFFIDRIDSFENLNVDIAQRIFEIPSQHMVPWAVGESIVNNLKHFSKSAHARIAHLMVQKHLEDLVLQKAELFSELSPDIFEDIAIKMIQDDNLAAAVRSFDAFQRCGLSSAMIRADEAASAKLSKDNLIKYVTILGNVGMKIFLPNSLENIRELIFTQLPTNLDLADYFIENLASYYKEPWVAEFVGKAIEHYSVAEKFAITTIHAKSGMTDTPWINEAWVADLFKKAEDVESAHNNLHEGNNSEHGGQGFRESDPYENHEWRLGPKQLQLSTQIAKYLDGNLEALNALDAELGKAGLNKDQIETIHLAFAEAADKLIGGYKSFRENFNNNPSISEEDKKVLRDPQSMHMTRLLDTVRGLVARYLALKSEGDLVRYIIHEGEENIGSVIEEGFNRYMRVYEVDVPLYNKLYEEFDSLRETGRYPLEVYLGRDGIYAWIGRRAQDVARRRKMGLEGRRKLKDAGEIIEINPQYTVYPRYFRDNLNYETKRKFLEQEGISLDADPMFYDTGYTGTIPEQIMQIMGFEPDEIEERIRLLSAPSTHRRVKGISENARSEIIEHIEHNAKSEQSAEGLVVDEKTGKIRHIAMPTTPEEQFYFSMISQGISRHYWLQEKLHHEPSGNVNLDSEHYAIRIRQEYATLLPQGFLSDPRAFFAEQGELLKGSRGEGPYPDEEITLFKIADGTEIVAKRVELLKAKEARKEFTILIAAKKAGLPTAEPVGFLSGKEEKDGSYLLMKKLEGRSGRKFEKELKSSGKYSAEQITTIMQTVADKNKEMAELFRDTLKIDKRWRIKDTIIEFNEETGEVGSVIPIDWERAIDYNPNSPKAIDEIV